MPHRPVGNALLPLLGAMRNVLVALAGAERIMLLPLLGAMRNHWGVSYNTVRTYVAAPLRGDEEQHEGSTPPAATIVLLPLLGAMRN